MFQFLAITQAGCRRSFPRHLLHRITTLAISALVVLVAQAIYTQPVNAAQATRPNIVFIMADDLGYAELGCYGQTKIKTPHLDRLAAQGMRFTQHYTSAPVCAPARCSLMTGKHGGHALVRDNSEVGTWNSFRGQMPLPQGTQTIATMLREHGYRCGAFGKWGLGEVASSGNPLKQGFHRFFGYNCQRHAHNLFPKYLVDDNGKFTLEGNTRSAIGKRYAPQEIADQLLKFIRENRDRPFFAYYPPVIPHLALQAPDAAIAKYRGQWKEIPYTGKSYLPHPTPRACYAAMISFMDQQVGRVMNLLEELELADNTVIFFTSDNGTTFLKPQVDYEFFESVGKLRGLKGSVYEGGIRVPLIVRWPNKIKANTTSDHISAHYDALATIADLVKTKPSSSTDGISYLPTLLKKEQRKHDALIWDFAGYGGQLAIRSGKWKLVLRNQKRAKKGMTELYNLDEDPSEEKNVAESYPEVAKRMQRSLVAARSRPQNKRFEFGPYSD